MLRLEDIKKGTQIKGLQPDQLATVIVAEPVGENAFNVVYKTEQNELREQVLYRSDEARLSIATQGRAWAFDASAQDFKLGLEAFRISLAHLFDPMMAVHTSNVEPLPHQITAVYESMLPRQPLRYVLADDPGAGKTIMAGLLMRELIIRADAYRILVVCPGSLTEQWQDELREKFGLDFAIFSREKQEQSTSGNLLDEEPFMVARLDQLARNEQYRQKLEVAQGWDLIIVDEAHKMSASYFGKKIEETQRFKLGKLLGKKCRHFLLMTATPHNGKESDFQLFMSLLDPDRFYGRFREGAHKVDVSDLMRRMVKEDLLKFDGTPLFPERRAYTAKYQLSAQEEALYEAVTEYVRTEMNRADKLGDNQRKGTVGFALTILQRRLASSPEAIYQSLKRRRKRLEARVEEEKRQAQQSHMAETMRGYGREENDAEALSISPDYWEEEQRPEEYERRTDFFVDRATAAATIGELEAEIATLERLEEQARQVVLSHSDHKWDQLSALLQDRPEMYNAAGDRRKLIIFTEHTDTLNYLQERIGNMLGNPEAVRAIHGGVPRDERRAIQEMFWNDKSFLVLLATDAAGEGVNLQNANLMVNYDLPWNPNRLEQRFGRIHRIGQTEVCHLWNLVAAGTREGDVFNRLFEKIEVERAALGGRVFDILGEAFEDKPLRDLLMEAIRYGEDPAIKAKMQQVIDHTLDRDRLEDIIRRNALAEEHMSLQELYSVKAEMEKAEARKLQPYFIRSFFMEAFAQLGGTVQPREAGRYEIKHVPHRIIERDRVIGESRMPVTRKYQRVCFEKAHVRLPNRPPASLLHPGHPLMASVVSLTLEAHRAKLKQGAVLLAPDDPGTEPKVLFMLEHSIRESVGDQKLASRRLQFVSLDAQGQATFAGHGPHLDLEPLTPDQLALVEDVLQAPWIQENLEAQALGYATEHLAPAHLQEVSQRRKRQADKTLGAVKTRLVKEIHYLTGRAMELDDQVKAGKQPKVQPKNLLNTAEELTARLEQREKEIEAMRHVMASPPSVIGGALVIPQGLLAQRQGDTTFTINATARQRIEQLAMQAVIEAEEALGHQVTNVSAQNCGWDLTSHPPLIDEKLPDERHLEVKGRAKGQTTVTLSKNEIIKGLNQGDKFILAIVLVDGDQVEGPYYVPRPFEREPDFNATSVNYDLATLLERAVSPSETAIMSSPLPIPKNAKRD